MTVTPKTNNHKPKRIGILTSGGDCPGLNAVIRAVVKVATFKYGWEVYGIPYGTDGFIELLLGKRQPEELRINEHGYDIPGLVQGLDILHFLSGSVLGSVSKGDPAQHADEILQGYEKLGLNALIVMGGDGSIEILEKLSRQANEQGSSWNWVAVPKTIDNDVPYTEVSVGFDTAVNRVTQALYDLTFTAASHDRVMVVQVMGRDSGYLAMESGIAGGADAILIPEVTPILDEQVMKGICRHIAKLRRYGRRFALIVVAEGVKNLLGKKEHYIGDYLANQIQEYSNKLCTTGDPDYCNLDKVDTRVTTLGHLQRAGTPTSTDRLLATAFGREAVELIANGNFNQMVIWQNGRVSSVPISHVIEQIEKARKEKVAPSRVDPQGFLVRTARDIGIYVGEVDLAS
ncbi:ATP-dependent 6-phosphofructokinase [Tumidithrix elongata RA019]|uniref:ATP-dependent 6-phosphofructokinase n=1 Tax=Tumidithrix elongata BACA0141 TaxID=2716417 RepID=A0AAW9Q1M2_9CYAN|nr:ATP-dependent 6-phosphofructokinase [Tumidithrix elongata RA019]